MSDLSFEEKRILEKYLQMPLISMSLEVILNMVN